MLLCKSVSFEMALKAVDYADFSQVASDLHEVTDRVDELETDLAQIVENLKEEARRHRRQRPARCPEQLHGKGPSAPLGSACFEGALAMQRGFPGGMLHVMNNIGVEGVYRYIQRFISMREHCTEDEQKVISTLIQVPKVLRQELHHKRALWVAYLTCSDNSRAGCGVIRKVLE